jgi:hypothetical protein
MLDRKLSDCIVIEEEERLRALDDEVIDAHRDQIDADGVVPAAGDGDLQLSADAVGSGNQDRILKSRLLNIEQSPETADIIDHAGASGRAGERLDRIDQPVTRVDIDARILVVQTGNGLPLNGMLDVPQAAAITVKNARTRFSNQPRSPADDVALFGIIRQC